MTDELTNEDVELAAIMAASSAAASYGESRFPTLESYAWRFLARQLVQVMYPFVKVAAYAALADDLREAGVPDVAAVIEEIARREMPGGPKEADDG